MKHFNRGIPERSAGTPPGQIEAPKTSTQNNISKKSNDSQTRAFTKNNFNRIIEETDWILAIGFSFFQVWNILCVSMPDPLTYDIPFLDLRWLSFATAGLLSIVAAIRPQPIQAFLTKRKGAFSIGAIATIGSALGPISAFLPATVGLFALLLSAVAVGIGFSGLFLMWLDTLISTRNKTTLAFGIILAALLSYPLANILSSGQINTGIAVVTVSALPIASTFILHIRLQALPKKKQKETSCFSCIDAKRFLIRFCLCVFLVTVSIEIVRGSLFSRGRLDFYAGTINFYVLILKSLGGLLILAVLEAHDSRMTSILYRIIFLLILCVVLCLSIPLKDASIAGAFTNLGSFCFQTVMTMVTYQICTTFEKSSFAMLGGIRTTWVFAEITGIAINHFGPLCGIENMSTLLTIVLCLAIAIAFVFVFTDQMCSRVFPSPSRFTPIPRFDDQCTQIAQTFNMSNRESEVFLLVAKGRSARRIAEELNISTPTVNSHIYHIYQKANVHSNQELIDLIEADYPREGL